MTRRARRTKPRPRVQANVWKYLHALATEFESPTWPHEEVIPGTVLRSLMNRGWVELFSVEPTINCPFIEAEDRFVRLTELGREAHRTMLPDTYEGYLMGLKPDVSGNPSEDV